MSPFTSAIVASLALLASAVAVPGQPKSSSPKFPSASVSVFTELYCAADSLIPDPFTLKAGSCHNAPNNATYISASICLDGAVPKGYECKAILYSVPDCVGAGTATAGLVSGEQVCYLKLTASSLAQPTVGGQKVGLVCPALADGSTIA